MNLTTCSMPVDMLFIVDISGDDKLIFKLV